LNADACADFLLRIKEGRAAAMYQALIVGMGPAGAQAAIYAARAGLGTAVVGLDEGSLRAAGQIDNYYGAKGPLSGSELQKIGAEQARRMGARTIEAQVVGAGYLDDGFYVLTPDDRIEARALLIATGAKRAKAAVGRLEAFEGKGVSYCAVCDGFFFKGMKVGVLGYTDYAVQEATELSAVTGDVTIYTNGHEPEVGGALEARLRAFAVNRAPVSELIGRDRLEGLRFKDGREERISGLFVAYGIAGGADFAKKLGLSMSAEGNIITDRAQAASVPGVFAAGDCTGVFRQIAVAVGQGAVAAKGMIAYVRDKSGGASP
jgi:thioredoxin reductase (NADPH)